MTFFTRSPGLISEICIPLLNQAAFVVSEHLLYAPKLHRTESEVESQADGSEVLHHAGIGQTPGGTVKTARGQAKPPGASAYPTPGQAKTPVPPLFHARSPTSSRWLQLTVRMLYAPRASGTSAGTACSGLCSVSLGRKCEKYACRVFRFWAYALLFEPGLM
jgi:hypothetical protein